LDHSSVAVAVSAAARENLLALHVPVGKLYGIDLGTLKPKKQVSTQFHGFADREIRAVPSVN
jgi:hypothetical protein